MKTNSLVKTVSPYFCMDARLRLQRQAGLSLIELMIAITLGLILLAGLTALITQQSSARGELEKSTRQIENGRYAMQVLQDDIQHAGYYGEYSPPMAPLDEATVTYTTSDPCATATANLGWSTSPLQIPVAIFGLSDSDADPSCVPNRLAGTDILVVHRVETKIVPAASAVAGETYLQASSCRTELGSSPFVLDTSNFTLRQKDCTTLANLRKYVVRIYYVSSCNVCSKDTVPTLKMVEFVNGAMSVIPVAEGIENLQLDYGIDTIDDGAPDTYVAAPTAAQWPRVMAVYVNLLARNNETSPGYVTNKTYNLGTSAGSVGPFPDNYKRHVFTQLMRATNPSGRRDQ